MNKKKMENAVFDDILSQALLEASERETETMETVYPEDILTERQMKIERRAYEIYERSRQKKRITQTKIKRVACFVVIIALLSTLVLSVPKVRAGILQLVNRIFTGYTLIEADGGSSGDSVVFKEYMLNYIPENFVVDESNASNQSVFMFTSIDGEKFFDIRYYSKNSFTFYYDNEHSITEEVQINSNIGYYSYEENDDIVFLNWSDDRSNFVITGNLSKEEMIKIAENMKYFAE